MKVHTLLKSASAFIFSLFLVSNMSYGQASPQQEFVGCGLMDNLERQLEADPGLEDKMRVIEKNIQASVDNTEIELV